MENNKQFPYKFEELDLEEKADIARSYGVPKDFISVGPKKYKLLRPYCDEAANIYNMPVRSDDTFVMTYQRSGTTWAQELIWLIANDLDFAKAKALTLTERYTFIELFMFFNKKWQEDFMNNVEDKEKGLVVIDKVGKPVTDKLLLRPSPRFIKTHLPLSLLPPSLLDTSKVVYVARDPRDVAVSSFHHSRLFKVLDFPNPFKEFWNLFIRDLFTLTPIFEHVKEAWEMRHHPNMLFLFYEELSKDLPATIQKIADFLGKEVSPVQIPALCDHLSIENFKNNQSVNFEDVREFGLLATEEKFIRTGKAGGWRDYFDEEMTQQAEQWIADNLRDTDLRYPSM
ncbi:sulfotransferase 1C4-like [Anticarsia gemmatalis]|uniref:sulfotransferase 1C4-like n=1 Tax=Anticarsia gemmatalis TaxID=129554 RepID=UPI003F7721B9